MDTHFRLLVRGTDGKVRDQEFDLPITDFCGVPPAQGDLLVQTVKLPTGDEFHEVHRVLYRAFIDGRLGARAAVVVERVPELSEDLKQALALPYRISAD